MYEINTARMTGYDGTDALSVSKAMAQGRRESLELQLILRKHFIGFKKARLKSMASYLGVRKTRRIKGDFFLTMLDFVDEQSCVVMGYGISINPHLIPVKDTYLEALLHDACCTTPVAHARYLIMDRDPTFTACFRKMLKN